MAPQPTMAIFTRSPSPGTPPASAVTAGVDLLRAFFESALTLVAVLGRKYQVTQERLLVHPQQVRLIALDVRADEIPVGSDLQQLVESARIPAPGQLELLECVVVSLELGSNEAFGRRLG